MKRTVGIVCGLWMLLLIWQPVMVAAGPAEDYEDAYQTYLFASVCRGAYSDRTAKLVVRSVKRGVWHIETYFRQGKDADAKFLVAKKEVTGQSPVYMLAIAGTESQKDRQLDLSFGKVYFAGQTIEEHGQNAMLAEKDVPPGSPLVHRGFLKYVQTALTATDKEEGDLLLIDELLKHPDRTIYLVGHSLGGAAATLGGAYLLDLGVRPEQIKVVTFGAPPVGNDAFVKKYENVLDLHRIVIRGDPVTGVLQKFVGGYRQFGKETLWQLDEDYVKVHHDLALYVDYCIKQYYQKRQIAQAAGVITVADEKMPTAGAPKIYVAPVENALPEDLSGEFGMMQELLLDEYRDLLPAYLFDRSRSYEHAGEVTEYLQRAADAGCQGLIIPVITATRVKDERNTYYVTLFQRVYRVGDRALLSAFTMGSNTRNMTPLEALGHGALDMTEGSGEWLPLISGAKKGLLSN